MIDRILRFLFSMKMMVVCMITFAFSIGRATFIESDYGTPASKIAVYNSIWFQLLLVYLSLILIVNIIKYRMFQKGKRATFVFHTAFLIIMIGAGLTRYIGYEGQMRIKEGQTSHTLYSTTPYFILKANDQKKQYTHSEKKWLSEAYANPFDFNFQIPGAKKVEVSYVSYQENMMDTLVNSKAKDAKDAIVLVIGGKKKYIFKGQQGFLADMGFSYDAGKSTMPGVEVHDIDNQLFVKSNKPFSIINMGALTVQDRSTGNIDSSAISNVPADSLVPFNPMHMFRFGTQPIVFKAYRKNVEKQLVKAPKKNEGDNYLTVKLSTDNASKLVTVQGAPKQIINPKYFAFAGLDFEMSYGAKPIKIPFGVRCDDFKLDRYPGSNMASSYSSVLTVLDTVNNVNHTQKIIMNHVMDYSGFRFFQSSYFPDESGTILSVNADWWGTHVTYIGYFFMALGMILSLFNPKGRMKELNRIIKKSRENRNKMLKTLALVIGVGILGTTTANAATQPVHAVDTTHIHQSDSMHGQAALDSAAIDKNEQEAIQKMMAQVPKVNYLPKKDAAKLNNLLVQDYDGRVIPFNTLALQLLRKIHRSSEFNGKSAVQTILAMHLYPQRSWKNIPIVYVPSGLRAPLGLKKYASVGDLEDNEGLFNWMNDYKKAHEKSDSQKNEYDKDLIKLGEHYRVLKAIFAYRYFRVVPVPGDDNGTWTWPFSDKLKGKPEAKNMLVLATLHSLYQESEGKAKFADVSPFLDSLKSYQWKVINEYGKTHPDAHQLTPEHVKVEIAYNKLDIFDTVLYSYLILGILLLIFFFIRTLNTPTIKSEKIFKRISYIPIALVLLTLIYHGVGLGMRWYITGHAPWSDGYEAVVFIAFGAMVVGFSFIKKNPAIIAATTLLAALMIFVTKLNLLDPQITPLEPVLKSYWLMIHVAVITSSYGFLGISAILGFVNLILYIAKGKKNKKRIQMNINEITSVSEIIMTVGLFAISIGTFLGGIWANESWGRYWGWDPKEVWALLSLLSYAIIIHLRWIPKLNNRLLFNVLSLWGYSVILFTFFGVNYILVGMHSYARGEGTVKLPLSAILLISGLATLTAVAVIKYFMDKKRLSSKNEG